ncbi:uncharacterized protein LOC107369609 [Tetranychus urticae]|uniref:uncharacterized protein LOC107369609 n=1 Tax=Tetranychus urticae TaxID=32264 RepID=UPI00077C07E9|nr:uncharacterized protein LOC107369609 [Tetranychus urticae]
MAKCMLIISILATLSFSVYCASDNDKMLKQQVQILCKDFIKTANFQYIREILKNDDCWQKILPSDIYARYVKCGEKLDFKTIDQFTRFCSNIDASIGLIKESGICANELITQEFSEKFTKCLEQRRNTMKNNDMSIQISK